jgi:hypothetical protein
VLVNLGILVVIAPRNTRPVVPHAEGSLTHLVHVEQRTVDRRYGFYMELGDVAAGGVLVVPAENVVRADWARSFSEVTLLVQDYDPMAIPEGARPSGEPIGLLETGDGDIPYWIIPGSGTRWWMGATSEGIVLIPGSVAPPPGAGS